MTWMSELAGSKLGQIDSKWDKSWTFFSDKISVYFGEGKIGFILTLFGTNSNIPDKDKKISLRSGMSNLASKLGQIGPKWDKSGSF